MSRPKVDPEKSKLFVLNFEYWCRKRGIPQSICMERAGLTPSTARKWKTKYYMPTTETQKKVADVLKIDVMQFFDTLTANKMRTEHMDAERKRLSNAFEVGSMIPIYGRIPAGVPISAIEDISGYMPSTEENPEEYFYLIVCGDSMIRAGIKDGCKVLVHRQHYAENRDIVVCRVNDNEATLKRFGRTETMVFLYPENDAYEPIAITPKEFDEGSAEILGKVTQIIIDV